MTPQRRRLLMIGTPVALILLVVGFLVFRPDTLFIDDVVDEELDDDVAALVAGSTPSPAETPSPRTAATTDPATPPARPPTGDTASPTPTTGAVATPADVPASTPATPPPAPTTGSAASDEPVVLARGTWTSLEHTTAGSVVVVRDGDDVQLVLADLDTSNGPDLHVILSPKPAVEGDWFGYQDGATYLGALKGNQGTQAYDVPDDLELDDIASVVIWCERFSVGFGAATLEAA